MQHNELISILHISDFHYTKRKEADQRVVVEALDDDVSESSAKHEKKKNKMKEREIRQWQC